MSDDITHKEAKAEFEYWIEFYQEIYDDFPKEFKFKYKRGREPDVLAFLILGEEEQKLVRH
jgi:hypothetical protein